MELKRSVYPKGQKPNNTHWLTSMIRMKKAIYTPPTNVVSSLFHCMRLFRYGKIDDIQERPDPVRDVDILQWCRRMSIHLVRYRITSILGGESFEVDSELYPEGEYKMAVLRKQVQLDGMVYAWLVPCKKGFLPLLQFKKCSICSHFVKNFKDHIKVCNKCYCGSIYKTGDNHELDCQKRQVKRTFDEQASKVYKKSKAKGCSLSNCLFSDLETFPDPIHYTPYCAVLGLPGQKGKQVETYYGPNCFEAYFEKLLQQNGILWFFNGGRFDAYFLFRYCLEMDIPIQEDSVMMQGSCFLTFTIQTKAKKGKGKLVVKDMYRFTKGNLKSLCKAYGLSADLSKGDFDHMKIRNWDDVENCKEEVLAYARNDVIAMREIFMSYSQVIWKDHQIHASKFVTASHLAYATWSSKMPSPEVLKRVHKKDEAVLRECYRGGRVVVGRPIWKSNVWEEIKKTKKPEVDAKTKETHFTVTQEFYDAIDDYCVYADVNSLYPSVMVENEYPVGDYKRYIVRENQVHVYIRSLSSPNADWTSFWNRSVAKIDCTCPKDLMIPFLMQRSNGMVIQNLHDKEGEWYTGVELIEAVLLGYEITKVHELMTWEKGMELFTKFINKAYKQKSKAKKDTPIYQVKKDEMNGLSGKFSQHTADDSLLLFTNMESLLATPNIHHITPIRGAKHEETIAWMGKRVIEKEFTDYPVQLTCSVLGRSKVAMSFLLRMMKIEKCPIYSPIYQDTDSYILHQIAWARLPDSFKNLPGEKPDLGKLKLEVEGKIVCVVCIAPKTYCVIYICSKTLRIMAKTRCKGIPHVADDYGAFSKTTNTFCGVEKQEALQKGTIQINICDRGYRIMNHKNGKEKLYSRIPGYFFEDLLTGKRTLSCVFGSMLRTFDYTGTTNINISPQYRNRSLVKTSFWKLDAPNLKKNGEPCVVKPKIFRRHIRDGAEPNETAYPPGHYLLE